MSEMSDDHDDDNQDDHDVKDAREQLDDWLEQWSIAYDNASRRRSEIVWRMEQDPATREKLGVLFDELNMAIALILEGQPLD